MLSEDKLVAACRVIWPEWDRLTGGSKRDKLDMMDAALRAAVPVGEPYAYEFGRSNGDGTYSVHIERQLPAKPHSDWPVRKLYAHPAPRPGMERELAEARAEIERLVEDRARFPDRPDDIGRMIGCQFDNLRAAKKSADEIAHRALTERDALAADKARLVEALHDLERKAVGQKDYFNAKQLEYPSLEDFFDEDGYLQLPDDVSPLLRHESYNGRYSEADWWVSTIRATIAALSGASIPAPALAEETRSLVREPMEWTGQGRYGFSSTVSAPIPATADKAEARREALEEAAKVADRQADADQAKWHGSAMSDMVAGARSFAAGEIAAAIRALIPNPARREGE